jgi:uncharacterized Zn-finger protein
MSFTKGTYAERLVNPTSYTSFNAFVKLNEIVKGAKKDNKSMDISINQNLSEDEINNVVSGATIIKILPPPTYTNSSAPKVCTNELNEVNKLDIAKLMSNSSTNKGMELVIAEHPRVFVDMKYATSDNFAGVNMYGQMKDAYTQPTGGTILTNIYNTLNTINDSGEANKFRLII